MVEKPHVKDNKSRKNAWGKDVRSNGEDRNLRENILFETAARLFNEYGYHGTSMSLLTEELGLTKGALYYYVKDKSDLLYKLNLLSIEATKKSNARAIAEGGNGYERIQAIVRNYLEAATTSHTETFIVREEGALTQEQAQDISRKRKELDVFLRDQIQLGIDDGSIVPCDPKFVAYAMVGAMSFVSKWYDRDGPMSNTEIASTMANILGRIVSATPSASLD